MKALLAMIAFKGVYWTAKFLMKNKGMSKEEASKYVLKHATEYSDTIKKMKKQGIPDKLSPDLERMKNNPKVKTGKTQDLTPQKKVTEKASLLSIKNGIPKTKSLIEQEARRVEDITHKKPAQRKSSYDFAGEMLDKRFDKSENTNALIKKNKSLLKKGE